MRKTLLKIFGSGPNKSMTSYHRLLLFSPCGHDAYCLISLPTLPFLFILFWCHNNYNIEFIFLFQYLPSSLQSWILSFTFPFDLIIIFSIWSYRKFVRILLFLYLFYILPFRIVLAFWLMFHFQYHIIRIW